MDPPVIPWRGIIGMSLRKWKCCQMVYSFLSTNQLPAIYWSIVKTEHPKDRTSGPSATTTNLIISDTQVLSRDDGQMRAPLLNGSSRIRIEDCPSQKHAARLGASPWQEHPDWCPRYTSSSKKHCAWPLHSSLWYLQDDYFQIPQDVVAIQISVWLEVESSSP